MNVPYSITPGVWFLSWENPLASAESIVTYSYAFRIFGDASELALKLTDYIRSVLGGRWLWGQSSHVLRFMSRVQEVKAERAFECPESTECVSVKRHCDNGIQFVRVRRIDQSAIGESFSTINTPRQSVVYLSAVDGLDGSVDALFSVPGKVNFGAIFGCSLGHAIVMFDGDDDYGWTLHLVVPIIMSDPHSFDRSHVYLKVDPKDLLREAGRIHRDL